MHQIKIKMIRLELRELLVKVFVHILNGIDEPYGKLGSQIIGITGIFLKCFSHEKLALPIMIRICGVDVIHPRSDSLVKHLLCKRPVDLAVLHRKSHAAEAEKRNVDTEFFKSAFFHISAPFPARRVYAVPARCRKHITVIKALTL